MIKHLLIAFLIFGFFITNAQDRQEIIQRAEARLKALNLIDFPRSNGHMDMGLNNQINPSFRGGVKHRLDRIDYEEIDLTGRLVPRGNKSYVYNANNQLTQLSSNFREVSPGIYSPSIVNSFTYENNKVVKYRVEIFNNSTGQLNWDLRIKMYYNSKGLLSQLDYEVYDTTLLEYKPNEREVLYYDSNDHIVQDTTFKLNVDNGLMEFYKRDEFTYNARGLLDVSYNYSYDLDSSAWLKTDRLLYSYDVNNYLVQRTYQYWDKTQLQYANSSQQNVDYDADGGIALERHSLWDSNTNTWRDFFKTEFVNDHNFNLADLLLPKIFDNVESQFGLFNKMLKGENHLEWRTNISDWKFIEKRTYIYSEQIVINTEDTKLEGVSFYPNPVESSLSIRNQKGSGIFELFNVQGQKIIHQEVVGYAQVDLSKQTPGFYFYKMTIGGKSATGKLVKN